VNKKSSKMWFYCVQGAKIAIYFETTKEMGRFLHLKPVLIILEL
jgi:hypothetical protein